MTTVPFFRPEIGEADIEEVVATLRSGWLTTARVTMTHPGRLLVIIGYASVSRVGILSSTAKRLGC